jgi:hypothetical protein
VTFYVDNVPVSTVTLASGQASYTTTTLALGSRNITVVYNGSSTFATGTGTMFQTVQKPGTSATRTTVVSSVNPSAHGQTVFFTASVVDPTSAGTPTGWLRFVVDGAPQPFVFLNTSGQATYTTASLPVGQHSVYAIYYGDTTYANSIAKSLQQVVSGSVQPPVSLTASIALIGASGTMTVNALTASGTVATNDNDPVSFTVVSAPKNGTITGNNMGAFAGGVVQFPGLTLTVAGTYTVEIMSDNLILFFTFSGGGRLS